MQRIAETRSEGFRQVESSQAKTRGEAKANSDRRPLERWRFADSLDEKERQIPHAKPRQIKQNRNRRDSARIS
jgi:hypothetical protein